MIMNILLALMRNKRNDALMLVIDYLLAENRILQQIRANGPSSVAHRQGTPDPRRSRQGGHATWLP